MNIKQFIILVFLEEVVYELFIMMRCFKIMIMILLLQRYHLITKLAEVSVYSRLKVKNWLKASYLIIRGKFKIYYLCRRVRPPLTNVLDV